MRGIGDYPGTSNDAGDALSEVLDAMRKASTNEHSRTEVPVYEAGSAAGRYAECARQHDWAAALRVFADDFRQVVADTNDPEVLTSLQVVVRRVGVFDSCEKNEQIGQGLQGVHGGTLKERRVRMLYRRGVEELANRLPTEAPDEAPRAEGHIERAVDASPTAHAAAVRAFPEMLDRPAEAEYSVRSRAADRVVHAHNSRPSGEFAVWHGLRLVQGLPDGLADAAGHLAAGRLPDVAEVRSLVDFCHERRHGGRDEDLVQDVLGLLAWPLWHQRIREQAESGGGPQWDDIDLRYLSTVVVFGRVREDPRSWPAVTELQKRTKTKPSELSMSVRIDGSIIASAWGAFTRAYDLLDEAEALLEEVGLGEEGTTQYFQQLIFAQTGVALREAQWCLARYRTRIRREQTRVKLEQACSDAKGARGFKEGIPPQWQARAHIRHAELQWARALVCVGNQDRVNDSVREANESLNDAEESARRFNEVHTVAAKTRLGLALLTGNSDDLEQSWQTLTTQTSELKRFPRWNLTARLIGNYAADTPSTYLSEDNLPEVGDADPMLLGRTKAIWKGILHRVSLYHAR